MSIDDYPYAGVDFLEDPELAFVAGVAWGDIGKNFNFFLFDFLNISCKKSALTLCH